ncbi:CHAD domain-containing protein [Deinococcus depolymerans]|uniref:CHAD domain-containing protein n=1 Tax=Deinococcus depolymerans TaxID=392408 RepID=A0ABP3LJD9_9DEIO
MGSLSAHRQYRHLRAEALKGDEEAVHRLRKLAREAEVHARVGGLPKRGRRVWKQVRRAASALRDHDVTGPLVREALQALTVPAAEVTAVLTAWNAQRAALLGSLTLPRRVPRLPDSPGRRRWERFLAAETGRVLATVPPRDGRVHAEQWHDWRKALKRYRAVLELRTRSPEALVALLRSLGDAQDAQTLLELTGRDPLLTPYRPGLSRAAQARRRAARQAAWLHWERLGGDLQRPV